MLEKKLNNISFIDRLLSIWYEKSNESIFNYYFNMFAKHLIITYLEETKNKSIIIKFLNNDNKEISNYKTLQKDIEKTFVNISFETFEEIIY